MADYNFKKGDCVRLKHGDSPEMNVNEAKQIPIIRRIKVWCKWFNSNEQKFEYESFATEVLVSCS